MNTVQLHNTSQAVPDRARDGRAPSVSILVPAFERPAFLRIALESALAQSFGDIEILIGDNSESDCVEELIASYADPRIVYHRNRPSIGPQRNWLQLVERARGPLVATLHDDDFWDPTFLASVVPLMIEDGRIAMTFTDFWIVDSAGRRLETYTNHESSRTHRDTLQSGRLSYDRELGLRLVAVWNAPQPAYAAVVRRDSILACSFPDEIAPLYDIWLSYQLVRSQCVLCYDRRRLTSNRLHEQTITHHGFSRPEDEVFRRIVEENSEEVGVVGDIRHNWARLRWARATALMREGELPASQRELRLAAPDLAGWRQPVARAAARSRTAWELLRLAKTAYHNDHGAKAPERVAEH